MNQLLTEYTELFLQNRHELMAYIRAMMKNEHVAEDVFQDVWLRLSKASEANKVILDIPAWSRGTARHLALHYWRRERNAKVVFNSEMAEILEVALQEQDLNQDHWKLRQEALKACIAAMPEKSRRLLKLKYEDRLRAEEVGKRIRKKPAAVLMAVSRIRKSLESCIYQRLQEEVS